VISHDHDGPRLPYGGRGHREPVPGAPALEVSDLTVRYPRGVTAVRGFDVFVERGECGVLIGPNGCGKSSVLKAISGIVKPAAGAVRVFGNEVGACHHRTAYLPQVPDVEWSFPLSVRELVMQGRDVHLGWLGRRTARDREAVADALTSVGLDGLADRPVGALSGGQRQRALLARALAQESELWLLDEPLTALDEEHRHAITQVIARALTRGVAVLMTSHHVDEARGAGHILMPMRDGMRVGSDVGSAA
jgi:ABC-type Mn2+/Zn2+ transport system ATPase subunit